MKDNDSQAVQGTSQPTHKHSTPDAAITDAPAYKPERVRTVIPDANKGKAAEIASANKNGNPKYAGVCEK